MLSTKRPRNSISNYELKYFAQDRCEADRPIFRDLSREAILRRGVTTARCQSSRTLPDEWRGNLVARDWEMIRARILKKLEWMPSGPMNLEGFKLERLSDTCAGRTVRISSCCFSRHGLSYFGSRFSSCFDCFCLVPNFDAAGICQVSGKTYIVLQESFLPFEGLTNSLSQLDRS